MNLFIDAFNLILYKPLFNILILLYKYLPGDDFGIAVIALTILIRFILYPLTAQSLRSQKVLSDLQPKLQEIQKKFKNDKEEQLKEMTELYQKEKINPFGSLLPLLIQLPLLIAIYQVFWRGFQPEEMVNIYNFISKPGEINPNFLGLINLSKGSMGMAVLAGITQFFQSKTLIPSQKNNKAEEQGEMTKFSDMFQKQMLYFFPIFTILILIRLPAAISLYWTITTIFSIVQQHFIFKKNHAQSN